MFVSLQWFRLKWGLPIFVSFVLLGALLWAKSDDPFQRVEFTLTTSTRGKVRGIVVLSKPVRPYPVAIFLHGSGGSLLSDGKELRQLAELGLAAVALEYDQANQAGFDEECLALSQFLQRQPWAMTNEVAWLGFSLGAQRTLSFLLKNPNVHPQLLVRLSGGWVPELNSPSSISLSCPVLLVNGTRDQIFPVENTTRLAKLMRAHGTPVTEKILGDHNHGFDVDRPLIIRLVAEHCRSILMPDHPFNGVSARRTLPFWACMLPAVAWGVYGFHLWRKAKPAPVPTSHRPLNGWDKGLWWVAIVLASWATLETAVHCITPQLITGEQTLTIARRYLIAPKWVEDFDFLSTNRVWSGKPLKRLLDHVELAHYNRNELIHWKVDEQVYREFVLSPSIGGESDKEVNWRRPLWESFYPRIRKEDSPDSAAQIVVRYLRERVTIDPKLGYTPGIETAWNRQITDEKGFEVLYVAALRSVGIGARLKPSGQAQYWTGEKWEDAPRPVADSFCN